MGTSRRGTPSQEPDGEVQATAHGTASVTVHPRYPRELTRTGQLGVALDSDEALHQTAETVGRDAGAAGVDVRDGAAPFGRQAAGVVDHRVGAYELALADERRRAAVAAEVAQQATAVSEPVAARARRRLERAEAAVTEAQQRCEALRREGDAIRVTEAALAPVARGLVRRWWVPLLIAAAVGLIDVGVLHLAFDRTGAGDTSVWLNTVAVPVGMFAMMVALGFAAGAIGLMLPRRARLPLAIAATAVGVAAVFGGVALLTLLRDAAVDARNEAMSAVADGADEVDLQLTLKTTFLGALQVAGVCAAIYAEALYLLGTPGARLRSRAREIAAEIAAVTAQLERRRQEQDEADDALCAAEQELARPALEAAAARVALSQLDRQVTAFERAARGATAAAVARHDGEAAIAAHMARNGGVRRVIPASELSGGTWVTHAPRFVAGAPPGRRVPPLKTFSVRAADVAPGGDAESTNGDGPSS